MLRLLPLLLDCRASLLRRGLGWGLLLKRRLWAGALFLLPGTSRPRRFLLSPQGGRGRSLHCLLLIVLPHYGVARLVTVVLAAKHLLLLRSGIPVP